MFPIDRFPTEGTSGEDAGLFQEGTFEGNGMMGRQGQDKFGRYYEKTRLETTKPRPEHWLRKGGSKLEILVTD